MRWLNEANQTFGYRTQALELSIVLSTILEIYQETEKLAGSWAFSILVFSCSNIFYDAIRRCPAPFMEQIYRDPTRKVPRRYPTPSRTHQKDRQKQKHNE